MSVDDRCDSPYTIVFDDDYEKLCPWADILKSDTVRPDELTDAACRLEITSQLYSNTTLQGIIQLYVLNVDISSSTEKIKLIR